MSLLLFTTLITTTVLGGYNSSLVSYIDKLNGWTDAAVFKWWGVPGYNTGTYAYNVLNFAFLSSALVSYDALVPWTNPTNYFSVAFMQQITGLSNPTDDDFRKSVKQLYNNAGIKVVVSCFGSFDYPTGNTDPIKLGNNIGQFVNNMQFDGVDIDWEDTNSFNNKCEGEYWLANLTQAIRQTMGNTKILTHAPQSPYFMGTTQYPCGGYLYVDQKVGNDISWYNIQFYNQASSSYDTYQSLFIESNGWAIDTSVCQMINGANNLKVKIPQHKVCVGKPVTTGDASNTGYVDPNTLRSYFLQAKGNNANCLWDGCFMDWEFSSDVNENFKYINTVASAFN